MLRKKVLSTEKEKFLEQMNEKDRDVENMKKEIEEQKTLIIGCEEALKESLVKIKQVELTEELNKELTLEKEKNIVLQEEINRLRIEREREREEREREEKERETLTERQRQLEREEWLEEIDNFDFGIEEDDDHDEEPPTQESNIESNVNNTVVNGERKRKRVTKMRERKRRRKTQRRTTIEEGIGFLETQGGTPPEKLRPDPKINIDPQFVYGFSRPYNNMPVNELYRISPYKPRHLIWLSNRNPKCKKILFQ